MYIEDIYSRADTYYTLLRERGHVYIVLQPCRLFNPTRKNKVVCKRSALYIIMYMYTHEREWKEARACIALQFCVHRSAQMYGKLFVVETVRRKEMSSIIIWNTYKM